MYLLQIQHEYEYFPSHVITCHVCSNRHRAYSFPLLMLVSLLSEPICPQLYFGVESSTKWGPACHYWKYI